MLAFELRSLTMAMRVRFVIPYKERNRIYSGLISSVLISRCCSNTNNAHNTGVVIRTSKVLHALTEVILIKCIISCPWL